MHRWRDATGRLPPARSKAPASQVRELHENPQYRFVSDSAQGATETFGVKSISVLAVKNADDT